MLLTRRARPSRLSLVASIVSIGAAISAQSTPPGGTPPAPPELPGESSAPAPDDREGHGQVGFRLGAFDSEDDDAGNPFYDESLTVIEPVVFFNYYYSQSTNIWATLSYDWVSSASIARLDDYAVTAATGQTYIAQSGASGDYYYGLELGLLHHWSEALFTDFFGSYSEEYDYQSFGLGGNVSLELADRDATIGAGMRLYLDTVDIIRFDGNEEGSEPRTSVSGTLNWYQVFSAESHGTFALAAGYQDGFLSTPYNAVVIEDPLLPPNEHLENMASGIEITEELPGSRARISASASIRQTLSDSVSGEVDGRLYTDSWGIDSITIGPQLYRMWGKDEFRLRVGYRYYAQTAADAYEDHFLALERYRTQDSDLGDFSSHTIGLQLRWYYSEHERFDIGGDYVIRSDYLDQIIGTMGWSRDF